MMEDHLQFTCPRRRARCEHCNTEFSGQTLEVGPTLGSVVCGGELVWKGSVFYVLVTVKVRCFFFVRF